VHTVFLKKILISEYGFFSKRTVVISHGVRKIANLDGASKNPKILNKFPTLINKKIVLVFGYFSPRKGYEYLIDAFFKFKEKNDQHNDWMLVLAGDVLREFKYYKKKIESLIKSKNLEKNILITGFVGKQDIDELYRLAKVVIIPAIFSFNTSGALSIALAYEKPILVANIKPLADEIIQNKFGILYDTLRVDTCVSQLKELTTNRSLYASLKVSLRKSIKKRYWHKMAKKHYSLYEKLIQNA